ncbi:MAG TPA: cysteine desulfurase-like protein [Conexibacter sp.]|nr:cysteine desulfurase-like protein [Conexibacter sp.]
MTTIPLQRPPLPDHFPGLERRGPDGRPFVHADAPGGTQVAASVIEAMGDYQRRSNANPNRPYPTSVETATLVDETRAGFARFVGGDAEGIVFGPNMTSLTWHFSRAFERELRVGDNIVCTQLDHDANVAPWLAVAQRTGAEVRFVTLDPDTCDLDTSSLERVVDDRTRLIAFTRTSNLVGTVVTPAPLVEAARAVGALTYSDGVAAAAHAPLRHGEWGIDVQVCSPYKFFGPHMGVLSARPELLERLTPDKVRPAPSSGPRRWETGMVAFESVAGLSAALRYVAVVGFETIEQYEQALTQRTLDALAAVPGVTLHGKPTVEGREATFALSVDGVAPREVSARMAADGVFVSAGTNYAIEPLRALGLSDTDGVVRMGFVHYHTPEDVDRTVEALARVAAEGAA